MNPYFLNIAFILSRRGTPFSCCSLSFSSWASRLLPSSILSSACSRTRSSSFWSFATFSFRAISSSIWRSDCSFSCCSCSLVGPSFSKVSLDSFGLTGPFSVNRLYFPPYGPLTWTLVAPFFLVTVSRVRKPLSPNFGYNSLSLSFAFPIRISRSVRGPLRSLITLQLSTPVMNEVSAVVPFPLSPYFCDVVVCRVTKEICSSPADDGQISGCCSSSSSLPTASTSRSSGSIRSKSIF